QELPILLREHAADRTCRILPAVQTGRTAVPAAAPVGNGFFHMFGTAFCFFEERLILLLGGLVWIRTRQIHRSNFSCSRGAIDSRCSFLAAALSAEVKVDCHSAKLPDRVVQVVLGLRPHVAVLMRILG